MNGKQLNAWFVSPVEYTEEADRKNQFREMAKLTVQEYLREVRSMPSSGMAVALAIWPEILPSKGTLQPLDAFEISEGII